MKRLTFTDLELEVNGCDCVVRDVDETFDNFCEKVCEEFQYDCPFDKLGRKLKAYEDTGLTPKRIIAMDKEYTKLAKELGEYKRLEEQGGLIKIPVPCGGWVYSAECGIVVPDIVASYTKDNYGLWCLNQHGGLIGLWGKSVFSTHAEAEKALEKMGCE